MLRCRESIPSWIGTSFPEWMISCGHLSALVLCGINLYGIMRRSCGQLRVIGSAASANSRCLQKGRNVLNVTRPAVVAHEFGLISGCYVVLEIFKKWEMIVLLVTEVACEL